MLFRGGGRQLLMAEVTEALIIFFFGVRELIYAGFNWGNSLRHWKLLGVIEKMKLRLTVMLNARLQIEVYQRCLRPTSP